MVDLTTEDALLSMTDLTDLEWDTTMDNALHAPLQATRHPVAGNHWQSYPSILESTSCHSGLLTFAAL